MAKWFRIGHSSIFIMLQKIWMGKLNILKEKEVKQKEMELII